MTLATLRMPVNVLAIVVLAWILPIQPVIPAEGASDASEVPEVSPLPPVPQATKAAEEPPKRIERRKPHRTPDRPAWSLGDLTREYNRQLDEITEILAAPNTRAGRDGLLEAKQIELDSPTGLLEEKFTVIRSALVSLGRLEDLASFDGFVNDFMREHARVRDDLGTIVNAITPSEKGVAEERLVQRLRERPSSRRSTLGSRKVRPRRSPGEPIEFDTADPSRESTVKPAYLGGDGRVATQDLSPTPEVQITPEIQLLATELGHSALQIFQFVRNRTSFEPYFGSLKGSQAALETLAGNDYDLASLTIALLRASNIPARYVRGTVWIPTDQVQNWLGVREQEAARSVLLNAGIDTTAVDVGSDDVWEFIEIDRVWVEAKVPHANYRGVDDSSGADVWVPLDPAFKLRDYAPGIPGMGALVPFDEDGYLATRTPMLLHEWYQNQVREWLRTNLPDATLSDVPYRGPIRPENFEFLPASLPYRTVAHTGEWSELPDNLRHRVQITVFDDFDQVVLDRSGLRTAEIALSRITLAYEDAASKRSLVEALGGPSETPAFLQTLTPQLKIDGIVDTSGTALNTGDGTDVRIRYLFPDDDPVVELVHANPRAGDYAALGLDLRQLGPALMERKAAALIAANADVGTAEEDEDELTGGLLSLAALRYWQKVAETDQTITDLLQYRSFRGLAEVLATADNEVLYLYDRPFAVTPGAVTVDAQAQSALPLEISGDDSLQTLVRGMLGRSASANEHAIWEEIVHIESVSTIRALQYANETDVNGDGTPNSGDVLVLDAPGETSLLCPTIFPSTIDAMETALSAGKFVKTPECNITINDWHGIGWIEQDPATGSAGYLIQGGLSGGATTRPWLLPQANWLPMSPESFEVLETCAREAGVAVLRLERLRDVALLQIPLEARRRIREELSAGRVVHALASEVTCGGSDQYGYVVEGRATRGYRTTSLGGGSGTELTPSEILELIRNGTPDPQSACQSAGLPVTLVNGNMFHQFHDLQILGVGPPLAFSRTYNSQSTRSGPMGFGWSHNFEVHLADDPGVTATVTEGSGRQTAFVDLGGGLYDSPPGVHEELVATGSGWTLRFVSGELWTFDSSGRLVSVADSHGNTLGLSYDGSGNLTIVTDALTRALTLAYGPDGFLDSVSDWTGRSWTFLHDANGDLVSSSTAADAETPSYTTTYAYADLPGLEHNLVEIAQPESYTIRFEYYANDKLFRHTESEQRTMTYIYEPLRRLTTVRDARGEETRYSYDETGMMVRVESPGGPATSFAYDADRNIVENIDVAGFVWSFDWDDRGRMLSRTDPLSRTETFTYGTGFPTHSTRTDRTGALFTLDVDPLTGSVLRGVAGSAQFQNTYDSRGRLETSTDRNGGLHRFFHDEATGQVSRIEDEGGIVWTYAYDALGRRTHSTDPESRTHQFSYDVLDRVVTFSDPTGHDTTYEYDGANRVVALTDKNGKRTVNQHDSLGLRQVTDPLGRETFYSWEEPGCGCQTEEQMTGLTLPGGRRWTYDYDRQGRLAGLVDPSGRRSRFSRDARGLLTEATYPDDGGAGGFGVRYQYDALGQLVRVEADDGSVTTFAYDEEGRLTEAANGTTTQSWEYGFADLPIRFEDSLTGKVLLYERNHEGFVTRMTDGEGLDQTYDYDMSGRLTAIHDFAGNTFTVEQDGLGRTTRIEYPNGQVMSREFGPQRTIVDLSVSGPGGVAVDRTFAHDPMGRVTGSTDSIHGDSELEYDSIGRLLTVRAAGRPDEHYTYDVAGNRTSDASGASRVYDGTDAVVRRGSVTFKHDARGNLVERRDGDEVSTYRYDWNNRLISASLADGTEVALRYDPFGRRIEKTVNGQTVRLLRDGEEVLARYDADGALLSKYVRTHNWAEALAVSSSGGRFYLHQDSRQSTVAVTAADGTVAARLVYDSFGNLLENDSGWDDPVLYAGRDWDPELGAYDFMARSYDPVLGRFLQPDPLRITEGPFQLYGYAGGDPVNRMDLRGESDSDVWRWINTFRRIAPGDPEETVSDSKSVREGGNTSANLRDAEHFLFSYYWTKRLGRILGLPVNLAMTTLYSGGKVVFQTVGRGPDYFVKASPYSWAEYKWGLKGIVEGMAEGGILPSSTGPVANTSPPGGTQCKAPGQGSGKLSGVAKSNFLHYLRKIK